MADCPVGGESRTEGGKGERGAGGQVRGDERDGAGRGGGEGQVLLEALLLEGSCHCWANVVAFREEGGALSRWSKGLEEKLWISPAAEGIACLTRSSWLMMQARMLSASQGRNQTPHKPGPAPKTKARVSSAKGKKRTPSRKTPAASK